MTALKEKTALRLSEARRRAVLDAFLQGMPRGRIARKLRLPRARVHEVLAEAEASGALPAMRRRLSALIGGLVEDHLLHQAGRPHKITGYEFGVYFDRLSQLESSAMPQVPVDRSKAEAALGALTRLVQLAAGELPLAAAAADPQPPTPPNP